MELQIWIGFHEAMALLEVMKGLQTTVVDVQYLRAISVAIRFHDPSRFRSQRFENIVDVSSGREVVASILP